MSYLNPPYASSFQELCAAMPLFYLEVAEMRAVLQAQGYLLDGVCGGVEDVVDFNFILTADEPTICRWEEKLHIKYRTRLTLDQRRRVVIGYIIGFGHIGEQEIRAIIAQYTEHRVDFDFLRGLITIFIDGEIFDEDNMLGALLRRLPAHLGLSITVHIRRQYRLDLPLLQTSVANVGIYGGPSRTAETIRDVLLLVGSGAVIPSFSIDTPAVSRAERARCDLRQSAISTSARDGGDTPPVRRAVTGSARLTQSGAFTSASGGGDTPPVRETIEESAVLTHSGFERLRTATDTPETRRASTSRETAAGGLLCYTRIKSKRID